MRKDSCLVFSISVLLAIGVVGGAYYLTVVKPGNRTGSQPLHQKSAQFASPQPIGNATPPSVRSDQIIKCVDPEVGEFYTNTSDCQSADLENRLSGAQDLPIAGNSNKTQKTTSQTSQRHTGKGLAGEPSLRRVTQTVPDDLNVSCKFAVGRALEIERMLSAADNPGESTWREDYCEWISEVRKERCHVRADLFHYGALCGYGL